MQINQFNKIHILGGSDFTINFWYKSNKELVNQESLLWFFTLGQARDALWLRLGPSGIRALINSGSEKLFEHDTNIAGDNRWHMMSLSRQGHILFYYSDGKRIFRLQNFFDDHSFGDNTDFGYYIGAKPDNKSPQGTTEHFNGSIDELKVYKRSISSKEVERLFRGEDIDRSELVVELMGEA